MSAFWDTRRLLAPGNTCRIFLAVGMMAWGPPCTKREQSREQLAESPSELVKDREQPVSRL